MDMFGLPASDDIANNINLRDKSNGLVWVAKAMKKLDGIAGQEVKTTHCAKKQIGLLSAEGNAKDMRLRDRIPSALANRLRGSSPV